MRLENMINNSFKKLFLNESYIMNESKEDIERFKAKFGDDIYDDFISLKNQIKSLNQSVDITYHTKNTSYEDMLDIIYDAKNKVTRKQKDNNARDGIDVIYEDDDWFVAKINTYEASAKYGAKTRWCISGTRTYKSNRTGKDYFNQYKSQGVGIYFFINSNNDKYALVKMGGPYCQIFDAQDRTIGEIPDAPHINGLTNLEAITMSKVYENEDWVIEQPRNSAFHDCYIITNKGDEEEAFKYDFNSRMFMDPTGNWMTIDEFASIDDSAAYLVDEVF